MTAAIGPRPWCGSEAHVATRHSNDGEAFGVWCSIYECEARGPWSPTPSTACAAWNRVAEAVARDKEAK